MSTTTIVLTAALLTLAFVAFSPTLAPAAASPVCTEGQSGCQGDCLVGVYVEGQRHCVPDPCYTTDCF